ncbi:MAG TPA: hypothetical protein VI172_03750 [Candidatus Dormibacteraeota bacterium]|jgi:hypothetical protein
MTRRRIPSRPPADPDAIAREALDLAARHIVTGRRKLAQMAAGDRDALRHAARIIKEETPERQTWLSTEHFAYVLVAAAYESLREDAA